MCNNSLVSSPSRVQEDRMATAGPLLFPPLHQYSLYFTHPAPWGGFPLWQSSDRECLTFPPPPIPESIPESIPCTPGSLGGSRL